MSTELEQAKQALMTALDEGEQVVLRNWEKLLPTVEKGGPGSGHFGHSGRPGKVGGSSAGSGGIVKLGEYQLVSSYDDLYSAYENPKYWILPTGKLLDNGNGYYPDHRGSIETQANEEWVQKGKQAVKDDLAEFGYSKDYNPNAYESAMAAGAVRVSQYYNKLTVHTDAKDTKTLRRLQKYVDDGLLDLRIDTELSWISSRNAIWGDQYSYLEFMTAKYVNTDEELKEFEEKQYEDTAIIAFDLTEDKDVISILGEGDEWEKPEDLHMTLMFLGTVDKLDKDLILQKLALLSTHQAPIDGEFTGYGVFNPSEHSGDKMPVVLLYDSPQLPVLHDRLRDIFDAEREPTHGFIPHITLAYTDKPLNFQTLDKVKVFDTISLWWGEEHYTYDLSGTVVEKELPIDEASIRNLVTIRQQLFYDQSDALAERMFTGEISLGQWEESMKQLIRGVHTSTAAIGKGGWDTMSWSDWGRLGTPLREQYRYLHGFAETISNKRDTISLQAIQARARLYGNASGYSATLMQAGADIEAQLPWMPKDGSTECLINCRCVWVLEIIDTLDDGSKLVQATWRIRPAEHCQDCIDRNNHVEIITVGKDVEVPGMIGGF